MNEFIHPIDNVFSHLKLDIVPLTLSKKYFSDYIYFYPNLMAKDRSYSIV